MKIKKVGVFVDAENISGDYLDAILTIAQGWGSIVKKKAYHCSWNSKKWQKALKGNLINKVVVNRFTKGKNNTDIKIICDVMKELYKVKELDTFVIASSDTDLYSVIEEILLEEKRVILFSNTPLKKKHISSPSLILIPLTGLQKR